MIVLVVNAYVRENAGDAALLSVLLRQLRDAFPGAELRIAGMEDPAAFADFEGSMNVGSVRQWTAQEHVRPVRRVARKALAALVRSLWYRGASLQPAWRRATRTLPAGPRRELESLQDADLVVSLGGGYLNGRDDLAGDLNVYFLLLPVVLAERLGTPVVFAPQSYGPFGNKRQRRAARGALGRAEGVFVREDTSMEILHRIGVPPGRVERAVDAGFAFQGGGSTTWRDRLGVGVGETLVGITARRWLGPLGQAAYERALAQLIDHVHLAHPSFRCLLIPQVTCDYQQDDDRIVERRVAGLCADGPPPIVLEESGGHAELKDLYSVLDLLVGTRFHSVIFALTSGVPCVAVEYEHKTGGIMRELGLEEWVLQIDTLTGEELVSRFEALVRRQDDYREHLHEALPPYVERAHAFGQRVQEIYGRVPSGVG